ncbi:MAG: hypothetical protein JWQ09_1246 [Segetibacter sp.]|nr:hypothetical protein [Segetibacter sp.]
MDIAVNHQYNQWVIAIVFRSYCIYHHYFLSNEITLLSFNPAGSPLKALYDGQEPLSGTSNPKPVVQRTAFILKFELPAEHLEQPDPLALHISSYRRL